MLSIFKYQALKLNLTMSLQSNVTVYQIMLVGLSQYSCAHISAEFILRSRIAQIMHKIIVSSMWFFYCTRIPCNCSISLVMLCIVNLLNQTFLGYVYNSL